MVTGVRKSKGNMLTLGALIEAIEVLRAIAPEIEAQTMLVLLHVALRGGDSVPMVELTKGIGITRNVTSYNVGALGEWRASEDRRGGAGTFPV